MESTTKNAFEVVVLVLGALLAVAAIGGVAFVGSAILIASVARAEGADYRDNRWVRQSIRQQYRVCDVWGNCERRWRTREVYRPRVYGYVQREEDDRSGWERRDPRFERGVDCKPDLVRVVGSAALSDDTAQKAAIRQWQATVAYDYGQKYMELANARQYRWRCDRASSNESVLGKLGEAALGEAATQKRCAIVARPCMLPMKEGDKDER